MTNRVRIETLPVGPLACNCSILLDPSTGDAVVIDPGDEPGKILRAIEAAGAKPRALLHTHGHFDHIGATRAVAESTGASIRIHPGDLPLYESLPDQAAFFGFEAERPLPAGAPLEDGETIRFGSFGLRAIHTPGHTPGSTCFLLEGEEGSGPLFAGDTLFLQSIGRTDLWGGDMEQIVVSIRQRLFTLPEETRVVCGHGPPTTIGAERRDNPFVGARARGLPPL